MGYEWQYFFVITLMAVLTIVMGGLGVFCLVMVWGAMNADIIEHRRKVREHHRRLKEEKENDED